MHVKKLQICNCKLHSYFLQQQLLTQNSHAGQTGGNETCYTVLTEKESEVHESEVIFFSDCQFLNFHSILQLLQVQIISLE